MMAEPQREVPVQRANWGFGALHLDDPERRHRRSRPTTDRLTVQGSRRRRVHLQKRPANSPSTEFGPAALPSSRVLST
jgi:hypothetical protein